MKKHGFTGLGFEGRNFTLDEEGCRKPWYANDPLGWYSKGSPTCETDSEQGSVENV